MRTALLLSGAARFCADFNSQLENLHNSEIDWIVVMWRRFHNEDPLICETWTASTAEEARAKLEPNLPPGHKIAHIEILDSSVCPPPPRDYTPFYSVPSGTWMQFKSIQMCDQRRRIIEEKLGKYDLVIKSRPDTGIAQPIDLAKIKQVLDQYPNILIMPNNNRHGANPFCDMFWIALPDTMTICTNAVDKFDEAYSAGIPHNPEHLLQWILAREGIFWPPTDFECTIRQLGDWPSTGGFFPDYAQWR